MHGLELKGIAKHFGSAKILEGIDLKVEPGEFVSFVGPSGSGKSTLLRILAGLDAPTAGQIEIAGHDVTKAEPVDRGIAMVFQNYALYPHMSVYENIAFPLRTLKAPKAEIDDKVRDAARILRLEDRLSHKPSALSGGQRQRVAIGRAIVRDPKIFLFDEPLSNLDAALRGDMRLEISELHARLGATMVYVTHDQVEAMTMSDRIAVLNGGRIEQFAAPLELYHAPRTQFVADFIGHPSMNMLPARLTQISPDGVSVEVEGQILSVPAQATEGVAIGDPVTLGVRPEAVRPNGTGISASVRVVEQLGSNSVVHCTTAGGLRLTANVAGTFSAQRGAPLTLDLDASECHVFAANGIAFPKSSTSRKSS